MIPCESELLRKTELAFFILVELWLLHRSTVLLSLPLVLQTEPSRLLLNSYSEYFDLFDTCLNLITHHVLIWSLRHRKNSSTMCSNERAVQEQFSCAFHNYCCVLVWNHGSPKSQANNESQTMREILGAIIVSFRTACPSIHLKVLFCLVSNKS